jgi:hypothetical protein
LAFHHAHYDEDGNAPPRGSEARATNYDYGIQVQAHHSSRSARSEPNFRVGGSSASRMCTRELSACPCIPVQHLVAGLHYCDNTSQIDNVENHQLHSTDTIDKSRMDQTAMWDVSPYWQQYQIDLCRLASIRMSNTHYCSTRYHPASPTRRPGRPARTPQWHCSRASRVPSRPSRGRACT